MAVPSSTSPATHVALVSRAARGGHPRYCAEVANALAAQGAEVTLIEPAAAFATHQHLHADQHVINAPISGPDAGWFRQEIEIGRILRRQRKSGGIVVFQDTSPVRAGLIGMLRTTTSWIPVTMVHNTKAHLTSKREQIKHTAAIAALAIPHRALVHNERQRAELVKLPFVRSEIDLVAHGTWSDVAAAGEVERSGILFFGAMRNNSGVGELLKIADSLDRELPAGSITVAGSPVTRQVGDQLRRLGTHQAFNVQAAFVSEADTSALFAAARFALLPYVDYSSESGVLMQAIAHQVPVITAGMTSVADRVRELDIGPPPTGSLLDQIRAAMSASDAQYDGWRANLAKAAADRTWDAHAAVILNIATEATETR